MTGNRTCNLLAAKLKSRTTKEFSHFEAQIFILIFAIIYVVYFVTHRNNDQSQSQYKLMYSAAHKAAVDSGAEQNKLI